MAYFELYVGAWTEEEAAHLYRRAGFGGRPEEIAAMTEAGMEAAVQRLVDYEPVDQALEDKIAALRNLPDFERIKNPQDHAALQGWWLYRMVHTNQPLQEQFTLFQHDHFVSEWGKVRDGVTSRVNAGTDGTHERARCSGGSLAPDEDRRDKITARLLREQNELLRQRGHGPFRDMLIAVTRDPAMLIYLDNKDNQKDRPQENYSRELMELFSMGVGNYTEEDVREVAKALTGETINTLCENDYPYSYTFFAPRHSRADKTVFGVTFNEFGRGADTEYVIDLILHQVSRSGISPFHDIYPATAVYMAWKFITWFIRADIPIDHPAVGELAEIFYNHQPNGYPYDVRETLRILFSSDFFYASENRFRMYKNPVDFMVMALRVLDLIESDYTGEAADFLAHMGMELFNPPDVAGWKHGQTWINSSSLLARFNYANRLSHYSILNRRIAFNLIDNGEVTDENDHGGLIEYFRKRLIQQPLNSEETAIFHQFLEGIPNSDNEAFRRKTAGLAHLMMTTPKYQQK